MRTFTGLFLAVWLYGCGTTAPLDAEIPVQETQVPAPENPLGAQEAQLSAWAAVRTLLVHRAATEGVTDLGLMVFDANDNLVFQHMVGSFSPDQRVAVASASKLVSGIVLFELIKRGQLSLDSTTGAVLGWTGVKAHITLRHLLSFTSGMRPNHECLQNPATTLAACVDTLRTLIPLAAPGARFDYGGTHLQVAARMAEVVTGKSWNTLFREILGVPLGHPSEVSYFTMPRARIGTQNPLVGGGLQASMSEYADFLSLTFHKGQTAALTVGTPALLTAQAREPYPDAVIGNSPMADLGYPSAYGLVAWLECADGRRCI